MKTSSACNTIGLYIPVIVLGLIAAFYGFNNYIYQEKQGDGSEIERYRGELTGEYVCLEQAEEGEVLDDCTPGIRIDDGSRYALDFALMSQIPPALERGDRFSAAGMITPIELLSTDHWRQFGVTGIFSVTDSVEVQE